MSTTATAKANTYSPAKTNIERRAIELPSAEDVPGKAPSSEQDTKLAEEALRDILAILRARTGHDFRNYKRATVLRRLERRLQVHGLPNLPAYRAFLHAQHDETQALLEERWADAVVVWMRATGKGLDAYPDEETVTEEMLDSDRASMEICLSPIFSNARE